MSFLRFAPLSLLSASAIFAQSAAGPTATITHAPLNTYTGFSVQSIDREVSPCTNFYQYACGTWLKNNPIPSDQASWGRFQELAENNRAILHEILESAAKGSPDRTAVDREIGDFYYACMDEKGIETRGTAPLKPELDRIAAVKNTASLMNEIARLHRLGVNVAFAFGSGQDFKDSTSVIAQFGQGGMGLPERDYYFRTDAKSEETRKQYVALLTKLFGLMGESKENAAAKAHIVMGMETAFAKVALDVTAQRDPAAIYHRMTVEEAGKLSPDLNWKRYLVDIGAPPVSSINISEPEFLKGLETLLKTTSLEDWKTYLAIAYVHNQATLLPAAFVDANFEFQKELTGQKEQKARWKRCVVLVDANLGEALGQRYVEKTFGADGKERMLKMVTQLEASLGTDIQNLDWMTAETKKKALDKLAAITNKIGFPDKYRDYSSIKIVRDDIIGDSDRASEFEFQRQLNKIGKPIDRLEWGMTPPTVNAYYDPQMNNINFPAGILQPPFFDRKMDDAVNFGGIGAVIGHELTHGFDDQGSQFDANGNFENWWGEKDKKAFDERTDCVAKQYGSYTVVDDVKLNGKLTLGENTADNGGLRVALMALKSSWGGKPPDDLEGFSPLQRFFLGWGQVWCDNASDKIQRLQAQTNAHSTALYRVNGVVSNMPEFASAFQCKATDPMVRGVKACRVW